MSNHVALNGDDGSDAVPARVAARRARGRRRAAARLRGRTPLSRRRVSHRSGTRARRSSRSAATSCCSPTVARASSPSSCWSPRRRASLGLRITGQLVAAAPARRSQPRDAAGDAAVAARFWRDMTALELPGAAVGRSVVAPRRDAALVRARRADPLSRTARSRAVLGRRLGHARCLPGSGRDSCSRSGTCRRARSAAAAYSATRTRTAIGRSGSCSSSASAPSAPATRTATSCSGRLLALGAIPARLRRRGILDESLPFFHPAGRRSRGHATRAGARRACAGADRAARDPGHAPRGLRPRRLERFAPARRPGAAPSNCAAPGPSRCTTRRWTRWRQALRHVGRGSARRRARGVADAASATTSSACSSLTASSPARTLPRRGRGRALWLHPRDRETGVALQPAADGPCDPRGPVHAGAGRAARRADPAAPARAPTARACSTGRCRTTAACSATFSARRRSTFFGREIGLMYMHAHLR